MAISIIRKVLNSEAASETKEDCAFRKVMLKSPFPLTPSAAWVFHLTWKPALILMKLRNFRGQSSTGRKKSGEWTKRNEKRISRKCGPRPRRRGHREFGDRKRTTEGCFLALNWKDAVKTNIEVCSERNKKKKGFPVHKDKWAFPIQRCECGWAERLLLLWDTCEVWQLGNPWYISF